MNDPFEQSRHLIETLNQSMRQALDPYLRMQREIQEQIAIFTSGYQEALRRATEPSLRMQSALDEIRHRSLINVDLLTQIQQAQRAAYAPSQQLQKALQEIIAQPLRINEALSESLRRWQESQQQHFAVSSRELNRLQEIFRELNNLTRNVPSEDFSVNPDGTIAVQGELTSAEEAYEAIAQFIEFLTSLSPRFAAENLFKLIREWIARFRPPVEKLLTIIVLPYVISIVANLTTPYFEKQLEGLNRNEKREILKSSRDKALQTSEADSLKKHRIVSATILHVRRTGSLSSPIIGRVYLGQIVKVCEKHKDWSLIEYGDQESGETFRGWVFTRYITRLRE